jgi:hypothetical protein
VAHRVALITAAHDSEALLQLIAGCLWTVEHRMGSAVDAGTVVAAPQVQQWR